MATIAVWKSVLGGVTTLCHVAETNDCRSIMMGETSSTGTSYCSPMVPNMRTDCRRGFYKCCHVSCQHPRSPRVCIKVSMPISLQKKCLRSYKIVSDIFSPRASKRNFRPAIMQQVVYRGSSVFSAMADFHIRKPVLMADFHFRKPVPLNQDALRRKRRAPYFKAALNDNESAGDSDADVEHVDDYLEASVVEAVRMVPVRGHLYMTMADGADVEIIHTNPGAGRLLYHTGMPTIFLRMVVDNNLFLPIVVGELAVGMLMKGLKQETGARPNFYDLMKELVLDCKYEVRMVRVTQRVVDTYHACICLGKPGEMEIVSVDARPSDAINLAARCKVPIFVNRDIVLADGVRMAYGHTCNIRDTLLASSSSPSNHGMTGWNIDCSADSETDLYAEEIGLVRSMLAAAMEERYSDAARLRDELNKFRSKNNRHTRQGQL